MAKMKNKEAEWLSNYLYFIGRKYPYVLIDLLETYVFSEKAKMIMIYRYIEQKTFDEISLLVHTEVRQVQILRTNTLNVLLGTKLS